MGDNLSEVIKEHLSQLPLANQKGINAFDWAKKCHLIGEEYKLTEEETLGLKTEVALVLLGLSDLSTLHKHIDYEIGGTGWENIYDYLLENVFTPIDHIINIINNYDG